MSTIIRTRSPYFIRTPQETDANLSYFQINITIKGGVLGVAGCPTNLGTYSLQKKPLGTEGSVSFDISELVNDFIEQKFINNTPLTGYNVSADTQSVWVTVATSARESDGTLIGSITTTNYLAQEGYNDFKDGVNYTTEPIAMISGSYIQYNKGDYIFLPVNAERVNSVTFKNNGSVISTYNVSDNGNANQKVDYAYYLTTSQEIDEAYITYDTSSNVSITVEQIEECKYPVHKIVFLNRWGAFQDLYFFKKSTESLESRSENFQSSIFKARSISYSIKEDVCTEDIAYNSYSTTAHAKKTFNANATESISLNTGFVPESMNPYYEELMVSEYVWLIDDNDVVYPVNLKDSSFTYKTGLNDKMINYTMNFEKSFNLVNNIR
tara:strand:+ start:4813 stop:5955 length:1143 start_codon:yes stop_codon:yes gene_type:complete